MYTSFFELLEATPSSDPFHAALADFIRSPDHHRPQALRSLWDQAFKLCSCPAPVSSYPTTAIATLQDDLVHLKEEHALGFKDGFEEGRREGEEKRGKRESEHARDLVNKRREGYMLGLEEGRAIASREQETELTKRYQAGRSNGIHEGRAAAADEIRKSGAEPLAAL
ncbi:hypothetical protein BDZ89DRAFT_1048557 [Hymenopellis radicata]|nr:hypothetical protein BDZ89DRAFT_1048557 [Hymenopellis radicata]